MKTEKFTSEIATLKKFYELYCKDNHENQTCNKVNLEYHFEKFEYEFELCQECQTLLEYSLARLKECPHDEKPRCRTCPTPCYEKPQWKQVAKLMRYSG
ncbi:MAG: nitrous oxide-stimulated promoter family protein, partial [Campylobacterota bacterium]|nr:nitrous oxide-stimulated promoter family protein [Campylobacterota bacterium]